MFYIAHLRINFNSDLKGDDLEDVIEVHFVHNDIVTTVKAPVGISILEVAHKFNIDLEGECGGAMACTTCHVYIDTDWAKKIPQASDEEEDMLDLAFRVKQNSRLGCQVILQKDMDGMKIILPGVTRNIKYDKLNDN